LIRCRSDKNIELKNSFKLCAKTELVLLTRIFGMAIIYMKASIQPKLGSWSLNSLVRDPNGTEFKEFLERLLEKMSWNLKE
jgi:hypothetical protein